MPRPDDSAAYSGQKYATEWLMSCTIAYDVVSSTAKTIKVRQRKTNPFAEAKPAPGYETAMLPVVLSETESDPTAEVIMLRQRKDGTYRRGSWVGAAAFRFTDVPPVTRFDMSF